MKRRMSRESQVNDQQSAVRMIRGWSISLGRALANTVPMRGDRVVATARDSTSIADIVAGHEDRTIAVILDMRDPAQVQTATKAALRRFGAIDVLANNAGHGVKAAIEEAPERDVRDLFETNFFGPLADYAPSAGKANAEPAARNGHQPGDPERAAEAIIAALRSLDSPRHLTLGKSTLTQVRARLDEIRANIDGWVVVSLSADFPQTETNG